MLMRRESPLCNRREKLVVSENVFLMIQKFGFHCHAPDRWSLTVMGWVINLMMQYLSVDKR